MAPEGQPPAGGGGNVIGASMPEAQPRARISYSARKLKDSRSFGYLLVCIDPPTTKNLRPNRLISGFGRRRGIENLTARQASGISFAAGAENGDGVEPTL